jgi:SAM-dependent methyltransferase
VPLHDDVPDLMLGTPGRWRIVRCRSSDCGLLWLDPRPITEDLAQLYANYFTHEAPRPDDRSTALRAAVRREIQQRLLGYPARSGTLARALGAVLRLVPWYRASALRELCWLPARESGLLLDVGCGNGEPARRFVEAGWTAVGIDTDAEAVTAARQAGLDARVGTLKAQRFPDAHFDLILMSHVIEHLADPLDDLKECRRVLKPSGSIVIATPNALGLNHRIFGRHWPGLDAPRHLQIFAPKSLTRVLASCGFEAIRVRTHAGIAASWSLASERWREAEATGEPVGELPSAERVPARLLALARLQSLGVALGANWGDELIGRYRIWHKPQPG